jgi:hypothetical protein
MATATLEKAEVSVGRDPDTVGADLTLMRRHIRRKVAITWTPPVEDGIFPGTFVIGQKEWQATLEYRQKYDVYRFMFYVTEDHSNNIARRFDITAKNPYTLCNDLIAVVATLRLIHTLDLEKD